MRPVKKFICLLLAILLLAGCAPAEKGNTSENGQDSEYYSEENNEANEDFAPEELEAMQNLAEIYESYCAGGSLSAGEKFYSASGLAFAFLYNNDLVEPYYDADYNSYVVSNAVLKAVNRLFFATLDENNTDDDSKNYFSGYWGSLPCYLEQRQIERLADGSLFVTYNRVKDDAVLCPVTYVFLPYEVQEVPEEVKSLYKQGDTLYKIVSVTQRTDLLPEVKGEVFEISTAEELLDAVKRINEGKYENSFDTYLLTEDIDLSGVEWTPAGLNNRVIEYWPDYDTERDPNLQGFNGVFDGQGHTISNLTITEEQSNALLEQPERNFPDRNICGVGFFYRIGKQGIVKNLKLENADVVLPSEGKDQGASAGLLAAYCYGRIENVSVQGSIEGACEIGGLVGNLVGMDAVGTAENCFADVNVAGHTVVGGMVGLLHYGTLTDCSVEGTVTAVPAGGYLEGEMPRNIGGMIGHSIEGNAVSCYASVNVLTKTSSACVGRFAGLVEGGSIVSCSVDGKKSSNWETIDDCHRTEPDVEIK